jgi:uncharacterized protein YeaC (DUF1315 family)
MPSCARGVPDVRIIEELVAMRAQQLDYEGDRFHCEIYKPRLVDCNDAGLWHRGKRLRAKQRKECVRIFCMAWWYI